MRNNKIGKSPIGTGDYPKEIIRKSPMPTAFSPLFFLPFPGDKSPG
jgi:hypothetical protein